MHVAKDEARHPHVTNGSRVDFYAPGKRLGRSILGAMAEEWGEEAERRAKAALIDTTVPNAARVTDYLYGGQNNFEADRKAARTMAAMAPVIATIAPAVRAFQQRVLRFLVAEAGIRQFLDVGTGLPLVGNTHEVAQSLVPECRIAYVDNDPMVLSHARALLRSAPGGAVGYVDADVRDPGAIVAGAQATLDLSQPVAVLLLFTLAYVGAAAGRRRGGVIADGGGAVRQLCRDLPPGERPGPGVGRRGPAVEQDDARAAHHAPLRPGGRRPGGRPRPGPARPGPRHRMAPCARRPPLRACRSPCTASSPANRSLPRLPRWKDTRLWLS